MEQNQYTKSFFQIEWRRIGKSFLKNKYTRIDFFSVH